MNAYSTPKDPRARRSLFGARRRPPGPNLLVRGLSPLHDTRDTLRFLDELAANYDDVVWTRLGSLSIWVLRHPSDIEHLLLREHANTCKDSMLRDLSILLGNGLLTSHGPAWRRHRRISAPYFAKGKVVDYDSVIADATRATLQTLLAPSNDPIELHKTMTALALEIVVNALFGRTASADAARIGALADRFTTAFTRRRTGWRAALPIDAPTAEGRTMLEVREELRAIIEQIIADYRDAPHGAQHLLDRLCHATDEVGNRFDSVQLRDELTTLFLAGHETTALALTFALREIGLRPELGAALRDEALRVSGEGPLEGAHLSQLRLTRRVLLEAMRLYPPAWAIGREVVTPFKLREWSLQPGDQVLLPQWLCHRDPRWFPSPRSFTPERWADEARNKDRPKMSYFPFGGGPRVCIGQHFSMVEGILALAGLCRNAHFQTLDERRVPLTAGITLRPNAPIYVRVSGW